jgi:hypothetical protein
MDAWRPGECPEMSPHRSGQGAGLGARADQREDAVATGAQAEPSGVGRFAEDPIRAQRHVAHRCCPHDHATPPEPTAVHVAGDGGEIFGKEAD